MSASQECNNSVKTVDKPIYTWSLSKFFLNGTKIGEILLSPVFILQNTNWQLELYPRGINRKFSQYMSLYLRMKNKPNANEGTETNDQVTKVQLSILDSNKKKYVVFDGEHNFLRDEDPVFGKSDFIRQMEMKRWKDELLPNDTLTICCEILPNESSTENNGYMYAEYFDNKLNSDVKFITADNKYVYAHKAVLINKSEVFADLFSMDIPVLSPDIINLKDISYEVVYEMFRFIYSGEVHDIENYAKELLRTSKRFKLDDLKIMCEDYYLDCNVSVENAIELLFMAENYELSRLKEELMQFVALNMADFIDSPDFQELMKVYPKTAVEIVRFSVE